MSQMIEESMSDRRNAEEQAATFLLSTQQDHSDVDTETQRLEALLRATGKDPIV